METVKKKTRAGSPNKTWCGVSIALYRRKKKELSHEEFRQWWFNKTGRSLCLRDDKLLPANKTQLNDLLERTEKQMRNLRAACDSYKEQLIAANTKIQKLENRSWIQRLFNSKV